MKHRLSTISFIVFVILLLSLPGCSRSTLTTSSKTAIPGVPTSNAITSSAATSSQTTIKTSSIATPVSTITGTYTHDEALKQVQYYQGLADDARATATDDLDKSQREPSMANFYVQAYNDQMALYQDYLQQANDWRAYAASH